MADKLNLIEGIPPFMPVETRGQAVANEWWVTKGCLDIPPVYAAEIVQSIADLVDRERSMVEEAIRQHFGLYLSELEGTVLNRAVIQRILRFHSDCNTTK